MSVFTNSATGAAEGAQQYIDAVLGLVAGNDPVAILKETASWCTRQTAYLTETRIQTPERPGKWSIAQVIQHLADSEIVWSYRLRMVLAEDRPELTTYDQDGWSRRFQTLSSSPGETLNLLAVLREANLRLLETASKADLQRVGRHAERGEESVEHMIKLYGGHDLVHRNQITRILGVLGGDR